MWSLPFSFSISSIKLELACDLLMGVKSCLFLFVSKVYVSLSHALKIMKKNKNSRRLRRSSIDFGWFTPLLFVELVGAAA